MEKDVTEARLKNGKKCGYVKIDEKAIFINNRLDLWQIFLLVFIIVTSILVTILNFQFMADAFNLVLQEMAEIKMVMGLSDGKILLDSPKFIPYNESLNI